MQIRTKKPKNKGVVKVPVVMQMEAMECGAACLAMISAYYGKWVPLSEARKDCGVSRDGANLKNVAIVAEKYGLDAQGYRYASSDIWEKATFPCIVYFDFVHFVVLCGRRGNKVYINDPAIGTVELTMEQFKDRYSGVCLSVEPTTKFKPEGRKDSILAFAGKRLNEVKGAIATMCFLATLIAILGAINPRFYQIFVDDILNDDKWQDVTLFFLAFFNTALITLVFQWIMAIKQTKILGQMAVNGNSKFMWHVLNMPMDFFFQRNAGDLQMRQQSNATVALTMINELFPIVLNSFLLVVYAIFMYTYNVILASVGVMSVLINGLYLNYLNKCRINAARIMRRDMGKMYTASSATVSMIDTIKVSGAESKYFSKWAEYQDSVDKQFMLYGKTLKVLGLIPSLIINTTSALILYVGVIYICEGKFTAGLLLGFSSLLSAFSKPLNDVINSSQSISEMRTDMERIDDVMKYPEYMPFAKEDDSVEYDKLSGEIELKNVTFGYSRLDEPLIKDLSLKIKPGSKIALTGASGCGKSTIAALINGIYKPWSGQILYDGKQINEIPQSVFKASISMVDQEIVLFKDTIENNISLWDKTIDKTEITKAAEIACIHEDVIRLPDDYSYVLDEGGSNISGGQRQRIEIARALVNNPSVIVLDEATSALDAITEQKVVNAINEKGITSIIIAHRLSTIRDCDEIIVLEQGSIVERGTHEELMKLNGSYERLLRSE